MHNFHKRLGFLFAIHYFITNVSTESNSRQLDIPALESYFSNVRPKLKGINFDGVVHPRTNHFENNPSTSPAEKHTYVQKFGTTYRHQNTGAGSYLVEPRDSFNRRPDIQHFNRHSPSQSSRSILPNVPHSIPGSAKEIPNYDWIPISPLEKKRIASSPQPAPLNVPTKSLQAPPDTSNVNSWRKGISSSNKELATVNYGRSLPYTLPQLGHASRFVGGMNRQVNYNRDKDLNSVVPSAQQWNIGSNGNTAFKSSARDIFRETDNVKKSPNLPHPYMKNSAPIVEQGKPIHIIDRQTGLSKLPSFPREMKAKPIKGTLSPLSGLDVGLTGSDLRVPKGYDKKYPGTARANSVLISKRPDRLVSFITSNYRMQTKDSMPARSKNKANGLSFGRNLDSIPIKMNEDQPRIRENYYGESSDDIGMISSFSYFRNPNLFRDFEKNFDAEAGRFKIVKQFHEHMNDRSGFPGNARKDFRRKSFQDATKLPEKKDTFA